MVEKVSVEMLDAVNMASILPAKVIGIDHEQGSIESGKKLNQARPIKHNHHLKTHQQHHCKHLNVHLV